MSKEVSEAHEERIGVSDSTRRERERWIETLRDAIKSGIPKHVRFQAERAIAGIEKSIRFGGTRLLRDRLADLEIERDALLAERDALKKDSERYRWLREKADFVKEDAPQVVITDWTGCPVAAGSWVYPQFEKLDAAIDAALQGEQL